MKLIILCFVLFACCLPPAVSAHILETSGSIGGVIHIDPDDDPIVGLPSTLMFELKDKENKFELQQCDCSVKIFKNDELIHQELLSSNSLPFIFPEKNIYRIEVSGNPKNQEFSPFHLSYSVRVSREDSANHPQAQQSTSNLIFPLLMAVGGVVLFALLYFRSTSKK
jgi:hypothetical protein